MGGAMSLIAIGWDGHIRGSGAANKMKKKSTHYGHGPSSKILIFNKATQLNIYSPSNLG